MLSNRQSASCQFDKIGWVLMFWGLPMDIFTKKKTCIGSFISKLWIITSLILKTIVLTVHLVYNTALFFDIQIVIFFMFMVGGYVLNFSLLLKRKSIEKAISNIKKMTLKLKPGGTIGSKWINCALFAYSSYLVIMTSPMAYQIIMMIFKSDAAPYELKSDIYSIALWFCSFVCGTYAHGVYGIAIIFCIFTYSALGDIVRYERDILKANQTTRIPRRSDFSEEIQALREISKVVWKSDKALSHCTLLLYAVLFCVLLSVTGTVIKKNDGNLLSPSYAGYILLFFFLFYKLTMTGSRVSEEGLRLKALCLKYADSVGPGDSTMKMNQLIFLSNVNELKLFVTVGHLFVINRKLFLTIGSAVITYGLVLYQF